jgi:PadR family transcriptional regulator AphA
VIELTPTSYVILGLLDRFGPATPYRLKQMWSNAAFWTLPHTQLYTEPERLAAAGHLAEERERTGRRRRVYTITAKGRRALKEWLASPAEAGTELRDPGLLQLFFGADVERLAEVQVEVHERKLSEYVELRKSVQAGTGPALALEAGIGHEREYLRFWSKLAGRRPRRRATERG